MIVSLYIFIDDTWMCSPVDSINIYLSYTKAPFGLKKKKLRIVQSPGNVMLKECEVGNRI